MNAQNYAKNIEVRGNVTSGMDRILDKPRCRVRDLTGSTMNNAAFTGTHFDTADYDTDGMWDGGYRIYIRTAGTYHVTACVYWTANAAGTQRQARIRLNGVTELACAGAASSAAIIIYNLDTHWKLNASDYIELWGYQDTGVAHNLGVIAAFAPSMAACLIST